MEGKEWVWDNGVIREVDIHEMRKTMERAKRIELAEKQVSVFKSFISKL
jgi:hypothetical protein